MHLAAIFGDLAYLAPAVWAWAASAWGALTISAAGIFATSIWQGAVIVCALEIALRLSSRISAAHRFAIWASGLVVALAEPWLPLLHCGAAQAAQMHTSEGLTGIAVTPLQLDARWAWAIAGVWLGAAIMRAASLTVHSVRLRRLWKAAQPTEVSDALAMSLKPIRGGRVRICTTEKLDRPSVIGFMAPRILIPAWLMARLTPGELEQIVLHEAEHLRRCDDWTNLLQKLALVAFPLNPALVWMEHRLCREREMACDEGVIRITNAPRAYAACLTSLAERGLERRSEALSLGAWHRRSELVHRVHGILWRKRRLGPATAGALLAAVGCALLAGSVEMSRCPQLVAFVPEQKSLAMTPARQRAMAAMLNEENAEAKMALPPGFRLVPAKAVMPVRNRTSKPKQTRQAARPGVSIANAHVPESAHQMAKAELRGDRVNPAAQQWVVLAAWEEVQTVSHTASTTTSDYAANATVEDGAAAEQSQRGVNVTAGQKQGTSPQDTSRQYSVTRLILRVVPANANSNSTQPVTGMMRGGWFVIQL
jgi:beta-lactamase regulating signal transducer with metallopeptidase domain